MAVASVSTAVAGLPAWATPAWVVRAYRGSLVLRLLLAGGVLAAASFTALSVLVNTTLRSEMTAQFSAQQQSTAALLADGLNEEFEQRLHALELASSVLSRVSRFDSRTVQAFLEERPVLNALFSGGVFVTGTDGVAVASLPTGLQRVGISYADRPFIQAALAGRTVFGEPVIGKKLGRPIITIAAPAYSGAGAIQGALVGVIDLGEPSFLDRISKSQYGKTGGYVLVAPASRAIVAATDGRLVMKPVPDHPVINRWIAGEDGTGELVNAVGTHLIASAKHLPVNGWYVAASLPVAEAYAPIAFLQRNLLFIAAVLMTLGLSLGVWIVRRELAPLGRAARVLLAHRTSGLPVRELPVGRMDEIGVLVRGFNELLATLQAKEASLEDSRKRLSALVESLYVGVAVFDANGAPVLSNASADALLPRLQAVSGLVDESGAALHAEDLPVPRAIRSGHAVQDMVIGCATGSRAPDTWVLVSAVPHRDAAGKVHQVVVTLQEISQQMRVREALQHSQSFNVAVLDSLSENVAVLDSAGTILAVNRAWREFALSNGADACGPCGIGANYLNVCQPVMQGPDAVDAQRSAQGIQEVLQGEQDLFEYEYPCHSPTEQRWFRMGVTPLEMEGGGAVVSHLNITRRKLAELALQQSGAHLRDLLHASPVPAFLCDEAGRITFVNQAFESSYGYTLADLVDINRWRELAFPEAGEPIQSIARWINPARHSDEEASGSEVAGLELKVRCKDGTVKTGLVTHATLMNGNSMEQFVAVTDITAQIAVKEALMQSTRDKEALLREVHHRVKNNLQVITSLLRLEAGRSQEPQLQGVLADMQGRIRSMALIHEMLYREGVFASMDLGHYLRQMATQVFRSQTAASGLVRLETDLEKVEVTLDQATPCGLLVNELISNCLKHAFPGGRSGVVQLTLRREEVSGLVTLCVSDDGVGLPADYEERRAQSLGMQLAIDLAQQIGGKLINTGDQGTRFEVRFAVTHHAQP